jgi:heme oxygenase (mycobilin-producing)
MIRVLIDRVLGEEGGDLLQQSMKEMRREAIHRPGYVSGETLRDVADPRHYVILSTWRSEANWQAWFTSDTRRNIEKRVGLLLTEPEKITVLELV